MQIIDFHVHVFPDDIAEKALAALFTSYGKKPFTNGRICDLIASMDEAGISKSVIQPVATNPAKVSSINNWSKAQSSDRIIPFAGIHCDVDNIADEINRIISLGIKGIKIQGNWQMLDIDNPKMYPIYESVSDKLIILFHVGAEIAPIEESLATPQKVANIISNFPKMKVVAAHLGGYLMWEMSEELLIGKNIYMDTSATFPEVIPPHKLKTLIEKHGVDRILFASDSPLSNQKSEVDRISSLGFSDTALEMILSKNAERLLEI
ncbi:MAG: amidohydrolase family protein [Armatimonadota bacterium]